MNFAHIWAVYFSATGTSERGALAIANVFGQAEKGDLTRFDASLPRTEFGEDELVVFGAPVYGGRIYKGAAERFRKLKGNSTPCIVTVTYGNRDFDDALLELSDLVKELGFRPVAAAALIGEHTYGDIQKGRPDGNDLAEDAAFAKMFWQSFSRGTFRNRKSPGTGPIKRAGTAASSIL